MAVDHVIEPKVAGLAPNRYAIVTPGKNRGVRFQLGIFISFVGLLPFVHCTNGSNPRI